MTISLIRQRLYYGWKANGKNGYHGYAWRWHLNNVVLDVWWPDHEPTTDICTVDMETVEAEVVFLIRQRTGQWPQHQTEIHFHPSDDRHRKAAEAIVGHYLAVDAS